VKARKTSKLMLARVRGLTPRKYQWQPIPEMMTPVAAKIRGKAIIKKPQKARIKTPKSLQRYSTRKRRRS